MNIHPMFVHFPIALLTIYSVLELLRWKKLNTHHSWFDIKGALVVIGSIAGLATLPTGEMAEEAFRNSSARDLVELHSLFATVTVWIYVAIAISYIITFAGRTSFMMNSTRAQAGWWHFLRSLASFIQRGYIIVPLSLIGLTTLTITGALGGSIVYGPDVDPVVSFIYHLFFAQ